MQNHRLGLEIPEVNNEQIMHIFDGSIYVPTLPFICPQLLITAPGFQYSASIDASRLVQGFGLTLSACDLELQTVNCDSEFNAIPDGIYAIKYAVTPYEYVYVEYNHFRLTQTLNRLNKLYCSVDLPEYELSKYQKEKLEKIREVEHYLKSAKYKAEYCKDATKAKGLYDYAIKLLDKLDCKNCG